MKVKALILCLAIVPLVAAQAPVEEETGVVGFFRNLWTDITGGTIDADRYREDLTVRLDTARTQIGDWWNRTRDMMDEFSVDIPEPDLPTAEEMMAEVDQKFNEFQTTLDKHMATIREKVQSFDPFDLLEEEAEAEPETNPEPNAEPIPTENAWYKFW